VGIRFNSEGNEYYVSFTRLEQCYFSSNRNATDEAKEDYDIYASRTLYGEFQTPVKMPESINTPHYEADVFVDPEENVCDLLCKQAGNIWTRRSFYLF
jgi:hypothetical protein